MTDKNQKPETDRQPTPEDRTKSKPRDIRRSRQAAPFRANENWVMQISIALAILFAFRLAYYALMYGLNVGSYNLDPASDQAITNLFYFYMASSIVLPLFMWLSPIIVRKLFADNYEKASVDYREEGTLKNSLYSNGIVFALVVSLMIFASQFFFYDYLPLYFQRINFLLIHLGQAMTLSVGIAEFGTFTYYNALKAKMTEKFGLFPYIITVVVTALAEYSVRTLFEIQILPTMVLRLAIVFGFLRPNGVKWKIAMANFLLLIVSTDILPIEIPTTNIIMALMLVYLLVNRYKEINLTRLD